MITILLLIINFIAIITMFFLNDTISNLQKENSKLTGIINNLNNEINYLKEQLSIESNLQTVEAVSTISQSRAIFGLLGVMTIILCGLTIIILLKNDVHTEVELSKNAMKHTGDYFKEVMTPTVDVITKASESRVIANIDLLKTVVTNTSKHLTTHVTSVNKASIEHLDQVFRPTTTTNLKIIGKISNEISNLLP